MSDIIETSAAPLPVVVDSPIHGGTEDERAAIEALIAVRQPVPPTVAIEKNPDPPELSAATPRRAFALDALRGLFLVSMTFGFTHFSSCTASGASGTG